MSISRLLAKSGTVLALGMALLLGLSVDHWVLSGDTRTAPASPLCDDSSGGEAACGSAVGLAQRLADQAAVTVWLNASTAPLDILWRQYVDLLIDVFELPREEAVKTANAAVAYGALNAKVILRSRAKPVENLLVDATAFYAQWEAEHGVKAVAGQHRFDYSGASGQRQ